MRVIMRYWYSMTVDAVVNHPRRHRETSVWRLPTAVDQPGLGGLASLSLHR